MKNEDKKAELQPTTQECQTVPVERIDTVTHTPAVDILEKSDEIIVLADLPGTTTSDVEIEYTNGMLTLAAAVSPERISSSGHILREYAVGGFRRSFRIGEGIDAEAIRAGMKDGVLTLHLPKREAARSRKIPVEIAGGETS